MLRTSAPLIGALGLTRKVMARSRSPNQAYAFVDTNIFLDFYRAKTEATLSLLEKLENVRDRIICTYQVEMEFLKNRQNLILQISRDVPLDWNVQLPAVLAGTKLNSPLQRIRREITGRKKDLEKRVVGLLKDPAGNDQVYKSLEYIFGSSSGHVLTRDMDLRHKIKRLAWRRFILGYPPRKASDTSTGDALNWEWIVHCGKALPGRFYIVSRDSDFGAEFKGQCYLNDALKKEFRERVGNKSIVYTTKLSEALRGLDVKVTQAEEDSERDAAKAGTAERRQIEQRIMQIGWNLTAADRNAAMHAIYPDLRVQFPEDERES